MHWGVAMCLPTPDLCLPTPDLAYSEKQLLEFLLTSNELIICIFPETITIQILAGQVRFCPYSQK